MAVNICTKLCSVLSAQPNRTHVRSTLIRLVLYRIHFVLYTSMYRLDTLIKVNILHASITTIHFDRTRHTPFSALYFTSPLSPPNQQRHLIPKKKKKCLKNYFWLTDDVHCALHFVDGTLSFIEHCLQSIFINVCCFYSFILNSSSTFDRLWFLWW